jgi:DNA polymerase III delta subunit
MPVLVLISGEEELLMERAAQDEAHLSLAEEVLQFEATSAGLEQYMQESSCSLLGGGKRTYIIWETKEVPALPANEHDTLIVVSKKPLTHPQAKRALKFPKLKSYPENNEVLGWILKEGQRNNIDLSRVAGALFVNCGSSLRKLATEVDKLALVTPPGSVVSPDAARSLLCFSAEPTPKEVIDSICDGQTARALAFLDKLQERGDETGWALAYMQRHVLQQLRFELLAENKTPDDRAAIVLGLHPFIVQRMYMTRRGLWTKQSLQRSIDTLCDLDVAHKRGSPWARFGLELEVIRLSEEAKDVKR